MGRKDEHLRLEIHQGVCVYIFDIVIPLSCLVTIITTINSTTINMHKTQALLLVALAPLLAVADHPQGDHVHVPCRRDNAIPLPSSVTTNLPSSVDGATPTILPAPARRAKRHGGHDHEEEGTVETQVVPEPGQW